MVSTRSIAALAILFQCTRALVEFPNSKLYEEEDFAVSEMTIPVPEENNRIYVSIPDSSAKIARKLMVHGVYQNQISLYDISQMKMNNGEKGYFIVQKDIHQISIVNRNPGNATARIVLWIVWNQYPGFNFPAKVFDAANLTVPPSNLEYVTLISAEPFTFHSRATEQVQPYFAYAIMAGYDEYPQPYEDDHCSWLIYQEKNPVDIQAHVQSPLITLFYSFQYKTEFWADVGKASSLDFSAISFVTSPGYVGCNNANNQIQTYRSFLTDATTSFKYSSEDLFDVAITAFLNTDSSHPVIVNDTTNGNKFTFSGMNPEKGKNIAMIDTNNLEISWTMNEDDLDQSFFLRLIPSPS